MSERYYITGVQLALLVELEKDDRIELAKKIMDNQFMGERVLNI
jgi:hypothetical protein